MARLTCAYDNKDSIVIRAIQRNIASLFSLDQEKKEALAYLYKLASKNQADTRILTIYQSIPGIAKTTALRLLAELGDLRRFDSPNQIDAFNGIDPGIYQSGELDSHLSITKHGNSIARKIMYLSIGQMESVKTTQPCHITDYYDRKKSSQSRGFKKIAIADTASGIVTSIYGDIGTYNATALWIGAILFTFQIYGDFSGYSDIAIGTARLFGVDLKKNFNLPYFSRNIAEFWKRWQSL